MKKLSIIIPVYNEEATLLILLERVFGASALDYEKEIIIVDDGSTDSSLEILANNRKKYKFTILNHERNRGKGAAVRTGLEKASGDIILIQDADLEYDPADWETIIREFENSRIQTVFGSRNIHPERQGYWHYVLGVAMLTWLINKLYRSDLTDSYTCFKAFRSEMIKNIDLVSDGFEIEAEICCKLLKNGIAIKEVPILYDPRKFKDGKKIGISDGFKGLLMILKNR